jgi:hypothetical protein
MTICTIALYTFIILCYLELHPFFLSLLVCSRALVQKLIVAQLVNELPALYGTQQPASYTGPHP